MQCLIRTSTRVLPKASSVTGGCSSCSTGRAITRPQADRKRPHLRPVLPGRDSAPRRFFRCGRAAPDAGGRGRRRDARLPARQPRRRRLSGRRRQRGGGGPARDRGAPAGARGARPRCSTTAAASTLLDRVRASDGLASRIDPDVPVIVLSGRGGRRRPRAQLRARGRRPRRQAVPVRGAARPRPRASCAARPGAALAGRCASESSRSTRPRAWSGWPGGAWSCPRRSSRCCTRWPRTRRAYWPKHDLLRDVWGYLSAGRTRTLDAHACRLRKKLDTPSGRRWVVNVRGVGYKLTEAP